MNTEANHNRRMANEARFLNRLERLEAIIENRNMVGQLIREGKKVFYFYAQDMRKPFESASETVVFDYIIRNQYVR